MDNHFDFNKIERDKLFEAKQLELDEAKIHYRVVCLRIERKFDRWVRQLNSRKMIGEKL